MLVARFSKCWFLARKEEKNCSPPLDFRSGFILRLSAADLWMNMVGLVPVGEELLRPVSGICRNTNASVPGPTSKAAADKSDTDYSGFPAASFS